MSLPVKYFRVTVVNTGFSTTPPNEGFLDDKPVSKYSGWNPKNNPTLGTDVPSNKAAGLRKMRGHYRYLEMVKNLSNYSVANMYGYVVNTGGTVELSPTQIEFTVAYTESIVPQIEDELNPGTMLVGDDAIKRIVARVLANSFSVKTFQYFDPTLDSSNNCLGFTSENLVVGPPAVGATLALRIADAEANITVTEVSNVG